MNQKDAYLSLKATGSEDRFRLDASLPGSDAESGSHRYFALQPIVTARRKTIGFEALYRTGWENECRGDLNQASRTMIDNWLLYGYEDLTNNRFTFLNCTRDTLLSGLLPLLPKWAVFEILETVEPDEEVLRTCRQLKRMGYRISLDDFEDTARMRAFLGLADFIKIDFRLSNREQRIRLATGLKRYGALLIAEKIETREEFQTARWEGFELFQGFYFLENASFAMKKDVLNAMDFEPVLASLEQPGFAINKYMNWLDEHPGVACRLLRRANWLTAAHSPVNSTWEALKLIGKDEFRKIVELAASTLAAEQSETPPARAHSDHPGGDGNSSGGAQTPDGDQKPKRCGRDADGGKILTMSSIRMGTGALRPVRCR